ncbi:GGDEF domain-containing protein [Sphingobium sp. H39-3-25]|uniref:GGDEF domain-containing protein n=1 Tax=Sphingobium arseniciresistens TaxID=3030834 RepID=UPI0023BA333A|nr:GGDEF domain-containing protein [Sphingobium arseniciresistens]
MSSRYKIVVALLFSLSATVALMAIVSQFPNMEIPPRYWIFGMLCSLVVSFPVVLLLVRQDSRSRQLNSELHTAYASMKEMVERDQLTGLLNRSAFFARAESLQAESSGWFILIDIDHFKRINDSHGHEAGDHALCAVATALRSSIRKGSDLVARIGGEEFAIYVPVEQDDPVTGMAERLRRSVETLELRDRAGTRIPLTISVGIAGGRRIRSVQDGVREADMAMYHAKNNGRNQVRMRA